MFPGPPPPLLLSERELLQEQAVSLQQEVSAWQQGSMLRGGPSGAEVAAEATLERSPSRTLASRVRELVGGRASPGSAGSSRAASPTPQRPLHQEAAAARRAATPAGMPTLAEEEADGAPPGDQPRRPLQQSLGRVQPLESPVAERKSAERAALEVQAAQLKAALIEAEVQRSRAAAAEAAAQAVLALHAAGAAAACPAVELEGEEGGHERCRQTIEGLFAQV